MRTSLTARRSFNAPVFCLGLLLSICGAGVYENAVTSDWPLYAAAFGALLMIHQGYRAGFVCP